MKIGNENNHRGRTQNHGEFTSILEESRWEIFVDKLKPVLKIIIPVIIVLGMGLGLYLLLNPGQQKNKEANAATKQEPKDKKQALAECLSKATIDSAGSTSNNQNAEYYQKLINAYDQQLGCYGKYPDVNPEGKDTIEKLKKEASDKLAASNDSKSETTTISTSNKETSSSSVDPETGCSYKLSTSAYSSCVDAYLSKKYQSSSSPVNSGSSESQSQPSYPSTSPTPSVSPPAISTQPAPTNTQLQECLAAANEYGDPSMRAWVQHDCHKRYGY